MKILLINNYHHIKGGAERYYFNLANILESNNHKVAFFSMEHSNNVNSKWNKYFVSNINFDKRSFTNLLNNIKRMFYSLESKEKIKKLLIDFKPDLVHINNIYYYISPSILHEIKKRKIPIIQTVHDYQLISPCIDLFHNGKICEITKKKKFYKAVFHKCIENSYIASLMATLVLYFQNILNLYKNNIDYFICPSKFVKNKLREYGIRNKIVHIPNPVYIKNKPRQSFTHQKNILFFGRLCEQKGIYFLLKLAQKIPNVNFVFMGNFDNKKTKNNFLDKIRKFKTKNIKLMDFCNTQKVFKVISTSYFVVIPSLWYEPFGYVILESYSQGKPVIASSIGGIPEIVKNGKTGLLAKPGNIQDFKKKILTLLNDPNLTEKMGKNAKTYLSNNFSPKKYYSSLIKLYKLAIKENA